MRGLRWLVGLVALSACSAPAPQTGIARPVIGPAEFALLPCGPVGGEHACALVVAGGKRVLLGAPAGVAASLAREDLTYLDAVVLWSLQAGDIEGLDEVRNASWRAGRQDPLLVVGPEGTGTVINAINLAYEQADALRIVEEGMPPGGFDAALLVGEELRGHGWLMAYDTGDLRIQVQPQGQVRQPVRIHYARDVLLVPCGSALEADEASETSDEMVIGCTPGEAAWPVTAPVFVVRN